MKKILLVLIFIFLSFSSFSQEVDELDIFGLPSQKNISRHTIGLNLPLFYSNKHQVFNLYYEYLNFEGNLGFQFPIKYFYDELRAFRGIFTGLDFVHHPTDHFSKIQFLYGLGVNPGFFVWEPQKPGPYKRQYSFAVNFGLKMELYYMLIEKVGVGIYWETNWVGRLDGYKQSSPSGLDGGGTMNFGLKALYRF